MTATQRSDPLHPSTGVRSRPRAWAGEVLGLARVSTSPRSFLQVLRIRLSSSKLGWLACPRPVETAVGLRGFGGPVWLRSHTTDISVLGELVSSDSYGPLVRSFAGGADRPAPTIIDLGANTGLAARWIHAQAHGGRMVCVEPEAGNVAVLRRNLADLPAATVIAACVGGHERLVRLATSNGEFAFAMRDDAEGDVPVLTMERILDEAGIDGIDLLKCDIEGAERELFADCASWINRVQVAAVECHDGLTAPQLVDLLRRNGGDFDVVDRQLTPEFGCEVVTLVHR